jgi:replicative DNA helicase
MKLPDRISPANVELEQALLRAVLVNNQAFHRVSDFLEPQHFFEPIHQKVFEICGDLCRASEIASPITLKSFLPLDCGIDGLTTSQYLARLASEATSVINATDYAREIRELAARREMIATAEDIVDGCYETGATARTIATSGIERLDGIVAISTGAQATRFEIGRAADGVMSRLADMLQNPGRQTGVRWGLVALDKVAPCLKPGNLVVMAGRPGMGKTGAALACALRAARDSRPLASARHRPPKEMPLLIVPILEPPPWKRGFFNDPSRRRHKGSLPRAPQTITGSLAHHRRHRRHGGAARGQWTTPVLGPRPSSRPGLKRGN